MENIIDFSDLNESEKNAILKMLNIIHEEQKESIPDDYCEVISVE
jgi:hypothetical protein